MSNDQSPGGCQLPTPAEMLEQQRTFFDQQVAKVVSGWLSILQMQSADSKRIGLIWGESFPLSEYDRAAIEQFRQQGWTVLVRVSWNPLVLWLCTNILFKARPTYDVNVPMPQGVAAPRPEE